MTTDFLLHIGFDFALSFVVAVCWGILFGSPKAILWVAGLLGGLGHCLRFVLLQLGIGLISSTLAASITIGFLGIFFAYRVNHPPVVFTMPACITMIPGMYAYRTVLNGIRLTDSSFVENNPTIMTDIGYNLMLTVSLLFTLAIGISIAFLLFRSKSIRDIPFKGKKYLMRRN